MEHIISIEEFHLKTVERKEAAETSRGHDETVIVGSATGKLSITTVQEKGSNSSVKEKFKKLREARGKLLNRGTAKPKIRKVVLLRDHKNFKRYCEPRVVSFGPIHHDEKKYRLTEEYKLVLTDDFIKKSGKHGKDLYKMVKKKIKQLREYYDEEVTEKYNDEALAWILFVDGCATLQFIHSYDPNVEEKIDESYEPNVEKKIDEKDEPYDPNVEDPSVEEEKDEIVEEKIEDEDPSVEEEKDEIVEEKIDEFKIKDGHVIFMKQDLLLLENQLPYQLLDDLMKMTGEEGNFMTSILDYIDLESMLEYDKSTYEKLKEMANKGEVIHLLDLLRKRLLTDQSCEDKSSENDQSAEKEKHSFRNVQELKAVGIHLKRNNSSCLGQISFTKKWNFYPGILRLPPITVDDSTGPKFFNLIAYEMCPDFENDFGVSSYIAFLDSLIDEAKDVMDLRKADILLNSLGNDEEVAQLFNGICTDLVDNPIIYKDVRSKIQDYCNKKWKTWISEVLHAHFNSPWTVIAFLAALFIVLATGVQTVYSVLSYYK